jgi:NitT/TauT family transport system permease protein
MRKSLNNSKTSWHIFKSLISFVGLYIICICGLLLFKWIKSYPDYVIPSLRLLISTFVSSLEIYLKAAITTFAVAIAGHCISVVLALLVAISVFFSKKLGNILRFIAFTIQAFPIIAMVPVFFIIIGDDLRTRLIITSMISYFPILLTLIGVLSEPVDEVEHFFNTVKKFSSFNLIGIRLSENLRTTITAIIGSATLSVVGSIVAEFVAASEGIGHEIRVALNGNRLESILVALFVIGIFNWLYILILEILGTGLYRLTLGQSMKG